MNNINFPLLKTFTVDDSIVKFLNEKLDYHVSLYGDGYIEEQSLLDTELTSGYYTENLLDWDDLEYQNFLNNDFLEIISKNLNIDKNNIEYFWTHILEYKNGGQMFAHKHNHNEDFVIFIYLKTCETGQTIFYLNDYCSEYKERTLIELLPVSGTGAIFSSLVLHEGKYTEENKRIFVVGVRITTH